MRILILFVVLGVMVMPAVAQRLASYDVQSAGAEMAGRRCPPAALPAAFTRPLPHPAPFGVQWFHGAIAAANQTQRLYWCNGPAGQGIQRMPWSMIGVAGAAPVTFAAPPGFNQITGMVVDPNDPQGRLLYVTDGFSLMLYRAPGGGIAAAPVGGPWPWPGVGGTSALTGLTYDPWNGVVIAVDNASNRWTFDPAIGAWNAAFTPPAVAVPIRATGIQLCLVSGQAFICYQNGVVRDPDTGMMLAFPAAPGGGVRSHEGLTYFGQAVALGGGIAAAPGLVIVGAPWEGNQNFALAIDPKGSGNILVAIDTMAPAAPTVTAAGSLFINPATAVILDLGAQSTALTLSLPLPTGALGTTAVVQVAAFRPTGAIELSNAFEGQLFRLN